MYSSCLDYWYKKDKQFSFALTCTCGKEMKGIIRWGDRSDKVHCGCGLVWEVNKPIREEVK